MIHLSLQNEKIKCFLYVHVCHSGIVYLCTYTCIVRQYEGTWVANIFTQVIYIHVLNVMENEQNPHNSLFLSVCVPLWENVVHVYSRKKNN